MENEKLNIHMHKVLRLLNKAVEDFHIKKICKFSFTYLQGVIVQQTSCQTSHSCYNVEQSKSQFTELNWVYCYICVNNWCYGSKQIYLTHRFSFSCHSWMKCSLQFLSCDFMWREVCLSSRQVNGGDMNFHTVSLQADYLLTLFSCTVEHAIFHNHRSKVCNIN